MAVDAVDEPVAVDVALPEMNMPPEMLGGEVLLPLLAAESLYASSVFGDGGALVKTSARVKDNSILCTYG